MKSDQFVSEVRRDRVPLVAGHPDAGAWHGLQAYWGLALNTLNAYGSNLERYLRFLSAAGEEPQQVKQETVSAYLRTW
jgi:integrase/recombinase XerD